MMGNITTKQQFRFHRPFYCLMVLESRSDACQRRNLFISRVFALKEFNLKIQANNPAERTLKEEFAKNGMKIPI